MRSYLEPEQQKEIRRYMAIQGAMSGFDLDRALLVRGDERNVGAVVLRDTVTRRQLDASDHDPEVLAELGKSQADLLYYKCERYQRLLDNADVYDTRDAAREAKKRDPRYKDCLLRPSRNGYVLIDMRLTSPDRDVRRCEEEIRSIEEELGAAARFPGRAALKM